MSRDPMTTISGLKSSPVEAKMSRKILLSIFSAALMLFANVSSAQEADTSGNLIYIRQEREDGFQLISLSLESRQVFDISRDDCSQLSPDRTYLALSPANSNELHVYRLADGVLISTLAVEDTQTNCDFRWRSETILDFLDRSGTLVERTVSVLDGTVLSEAEETLSPRPSLIVPDLLADDFRLLSPDDSLIVYNRCKGNAFTTNTFTGDLVCSSEEEVVVYDLKTQQVYEVLSDARQGHFVVGEYELLAYSFGGIDWSPSGRYLAYVTTNADTSIPPLRIYDTHDRRYIDLFFPRDLGMNRVKGFVWSQNEEALVFWGMDHAALSERLVIAEVDTGQVRVSSTLYDLAQAGWARGLGNTIVFVDSENNLVEYDLDTNRTIVLDTDVWHVFSR